MPDSENKQTRPRRLYLLAGFLLAVLYAMNSGEGVAPTIEPENTTDAFGSLRRYGIQYLVML